MRAPAAGRGRPSQPSPLPIALAANCPDQCGPRWWPRTHPIDLVPERGHLPDGKSPKDEPPAVADSFNCQSRIDPGRIHRMAGCRPVEPLATETPLVGRQPNAASNYPFLPIPI